MPDIVPDEIEIGKEDKAQDERSNESGLVDSLGCSLADPAESVPTIS